MYKPRSEASEAIPLPTPSSLFSLAAMRQDLGYLRPSLCWGEPNGDPTPCPQVLPFHGGEQLLSGRERGGTEWQVSADRSGSCCGTGGEPCLLRGRPGSFSRFLVLELLASTLVFE